MQQGGGEDGGNLNVVDRCHNGRHEGLQGAVRQDQVATRWDGAMRQDEATRWGKGTRQGKGTRRGEGMNVVLDIGACLCGGFLPDS